jgi:hypothetical protein
LGQKGECHVSDQKWSGDGGRHRHIGITGSHRRVKVLATLTERVGSVTVGSHRRVTVKIAK